MHEKTFLTWFARSYGLKGRQLGTLLLGYMVVLLVHETLVYNSNDPAKQMLMLILNAHAWYVLLLYYLEFFDSCLDLIDHWIKLYLLYIYIYMYLVRVIMIYWTST